jgi:hypothetical protein
MSKCNFYFATEGVVHNSRFAPKFSGTDPGFYRYISGHTVISTLQSYQCKAITK